MYDYFMEIKTKGPEAGMHFRNGNQDHPMSRFGAFDLAGFPKVVEWEKRYLPPEKLDRYEKSIGQYDPREEKKSPIMVLRRFSASTTNMSIIRPLAQCSTQTRKWRRSRPVGKSAPLANPSNYQRRPGPPEPP